MQDASWRWPYHGASLPWGQFKAPPALSNILPINGKRGGMLQEPRGRKPGPGLGVQGDGQSPPKIHPSPEDQTQTPKDARRIPEALGRGRRGSLGTRGISRDIFLSQTPLRTTFPSMRFERACFFLGQVISAQDRSHLPGRGDARRALTSRAGRTPFAWDNPLLFLSSRKGQKKSQNPLLLTGKNSPFPMKSPFQPHLVSPHPRGGWWEGCDANPAAPRCTHAVLT